MEETKFGKVKLLYGEPLLGKCAIEEFFEVELVVPGVRDGEIVVSIDKEKMTVEMLEDSKYCKRFGIEFSSEHVDFNDIDATKSDGVVYISCRIKEEDEVKPNKFAL